MSATVVPLLTAVNFLFETFTILLLARVIMSWFRPRTHNKWYWRLEGIVYRLTEPVLGPIRDRLPMSNYGFDFSPIVAYFLIIIVRRVFFTLVAWIL